MTTTTPATAGPDADTDKDSADERYPLTWMGQTYLVGEEIYLRPIEKSDAKWATSFRTTGYPLSPDITEDWITDEMLKGDGKQALGIVRKSDHRVVGGVTIYRTSIYGRWLELHTDPAFGDRGDRWRSEALRLILPWAVLEQHRPILHIVVPASDTTLLDTAREAGMRETARFRDATFRDARRVDQVVLEYLNPAWVRTLGDPAEEELGRIGTGQPRPVPAPVTLEGDPPVNALAIGERVYLRPFTKDDAAEFAIQSRREPESPFSIGRWLDHKLMKWNQFEGYQKEAFPEWVRFAVVHRETGELLGGNGVLDIHYRDRRGETESFFLPDAREQGYGSEAKHLALGYAFDRMHLHTVVSWVVFPNTRSAAALRKQGYREAGRIHWVYPDHGGFGHCAVFDLLGSEWRAMPRT